MDRREKLSCLVDDELDSVELHSTFRALTEDDRSTLDSYHLVGDLLRSEELVRHHRPDLLASISEALDAEPTVLVSQPKWGSQTKQGWFEVIGGARMLATAAAISVFSWSLNWAVPAIESDWQRGAVAKVKPAITSDEMALWQEYFSAHQQNAVASGLAGVSPIARAETEFANVVTPDEAPKVEWMNVWAPQGNSN